LTIDTEGYERAMSRQRTQSQESWKGSGAEEVPEAFRRLAARGVSTLFLGYETLEVEAKVIAIMRNGTETAEAHQGNEVEVVLDRTSFYGEAGGQIGDKGWLVARDMRMVVEDTRKYGQDIIVHRGRMEKGDLSLGDPVRAVVDGERRRATALNHTATHLLHKALREILGDHVKQAGSLVTAERFRFDFSHFTQVDTEKLKEVEKLVNDYIRENLPLTIEEMPREEAMKTGAIAIFEERYGEKVRLVRIGDGLSMELCGGTHTSRTGNIGLFKIIGESAVGANVRRIEALTAKTALEHIQNQEEVLREIAALLKSTTEQARDKVERLAKDLKQREREIEQLKARLLTSQSVDLLSGVRQVGETKLLVREVTADSPKALREFADRIRDRLKSGIIVLGARNEGKALLICVVTKDLVDRYRAGEIIKHLSALVGGKGGGRADMAQGGGSRPEELGRALESVYDLIKRAT